MLIAEFVRILCLPKPLAFASVRRPSRYRHGRIHAIGRELGGARRCTPLRTGRRGLGAGTEMICLIRLQRFGSRESPRSCVLRRVWLYGRCPRISGVFWKRAVFSFGILILCYNYWFWAFETFWIVAYLDWSDLRLVAWKIAVVWIYYGCGSYPSVCRRQWGDHCSPYALLWV